jgi:hypothetical protein
MSVTEPVGKMAVRGVPMVEFLEILPAMVVALSVKKPPLVRGVWFSQPVTELIAPSSTYRRLPNSATRIKHMFEMSLDFSSFML